MKRLALSLATLVILITAFSFTQKKKPRVLIFSKTAGYYHKSIPLGIEAIKKIGIENGFDVDTTTDSTSFTDKNLKRYAALIFLSTTGNLFDTFQKQALVKYIHRGGSFIGVHSATDCEYNWPWYGKLVGAYFDSHPAQQQANLTVVDAINPSTKELPPTWTRLDEWYNFKNINPDIHVVMTIDEGSYKGGKNGATHPMAWWHNFEGGYVFYTALGHTDASYTEPLFLKHLTGGILFALHKND